jgi:hypothetical protein
MVAVHMTPEKLQQRLAEMEDRIDEDELVEALTYVRDDGR